MASPPAGCCRCPASHSHTLYSAGASRLASRLPVASPFTLTGERSNIVPSENPAHRAQSVPGVSVAGKSRQILLHPAQPFCRRPAAGCRDKLARPAAGRQKNRWRRDQQRSVCRRLAMSSCHIASGCRCACWLQYRAGLDQNDCRDLQRIAHSIAAHTWQCATSRPAGHNASWRPFAKPQIGHQIRQFPNHSGYFRCSDEITFFRPAILAGIIKSIGDRPISPSGSRPRGSTVAIICCTGLGPPLMPSGNALVSAHCSRRARLPFAVKDSHAPSKSSAPVSHWPMLKPDLLDQPSQSGYPAGRKNSTVKRLKP